MTSKNNNNDDNPQNTKHCVLIDGDFGRHELFSNIHPYTLNRPGKLNDTLTFNTYTEKARKLMNDAANIHYHICYNSFSVEIDEYYKILKMLYPQSVWLHSSINTTTDKNHDANNYLQIKDIMSRHECDYMWIIHGIENHYEELIERLKSNYNSKANISSYCWLENLKDGSNRIEYLVNNKIKYQTEDRIERLKTQPILTESISIATKSSEQNKKSKTKIKCDLGCERQFTTLEALKSHQFIAEHLITHLIGYEETTTLMSTTDKPKKVGKTKKVVCDFDGCGKPFKNLNRLKKHQLAKHSPDQSVINEETKISASTRKKPKKTGKTEKVVCDFDGCGKLFKNLNALTSHQLAEHSGDHPVINEETMISASKTKKPKKAGETTQIIWDFDACKELFTNLSALGNHQLATHFTTDKSKKTRKIKNVKCDFNGCRKSFKNLNALTDHQLAKHSGDHPVINEETMISASTTEKSQKTSKTIQFICDFDACKELFTNLSALGNHQLATHPTTQSVINEETMISASTTEKSQKTSKTTQFIRDFDSCEEPFTNLSALGNHQLATHPTTQSVINEETITSVSTTDKSKKTRKIKKVKCDFNGCGKSFKNLNALTNHQLAKHSPDQPVINEEAIISASTTEKPNNATKKSKMECGFDDCRLSFRRRRTLQKHQIETHPIPLQCLFSKACLDSNEKYLGILNLQNHIILQHKDSFRQQICPIDRCKNQKVWDDWSAALQHILKRHTKYLLDSIASHIQTTPPMNISSWDLGDPFKCAYNDCDRFYWEEEALKRHEAFEHPVALLCPFCSKCKHSSRKYIGLWSLRRHVTFVHAPLFSQPTCFDSECKSEEKKLSESWNKVLRHILVKHLEAVGVINESTTTKHNVYKKCSYDTCNKPFKTRNAFLHHLITDHPYPLRCPYDSECNNIVSGKVYLGSMELERHIKADHSVQFSEPMCFDSKCQQEKHFQDWNIVVRHILEKHLLDIK